MIDEIIVVERGDQTQNVEWKIQSQNLLSVEIKLKIYLSRIDRSFMLVPLVTFEWP